MASIGLSKVMFGALAALLLIQVLVVLSAPAAEVETERAVRQTSGVQQQDEFMRAFINAYIMNKMGGGGGGADDLDKRGRSKNCRVNLVSCFGKRKRR